MKKSFLAAGLAFLFIGCNSVSGHESVNYRKSYDSLEFVQVIIESSPTPAVILKSEIYVEPTPKAIPKPKPVPKPIVKPMAVASTKTDAQKYAASKLNDKQYACLYKLWMRESHWNPLALNKKSGAYGIPQALPGSKMASAGDDWETNPITQVKWGLGYISGRYDTACNALNHAITYGWY